MSPEEMLADWHTLLPEYMQKWELSRDDVRPSHCMCMQLHVIMGICGLECLN